TAASSLRRRQPRRYPHQPLTCGNERLLETARDVPTVLDRPQPLLAQRASPLDQLRIDRAACLGEAAAKLVDGDRGQRVLVYVQPNNDHPTRLLPLETTVERTDLNRGKLPSSYQVTLGGLREGGGDITLDSQLQGATFRNRVSRRQPELSNSNQTARAQDDIEFRNDARTAVACFPCADPGRRRLAVGEWRRTPRRSPGHFWHPGRS